MFCREAAALLPARWRLLPLYRCNPKTGEWKHWRRIRSFPERRWLAHVPFFAQLKAGDAAPPTAATGSDSDSAASVPPMDAPNDAAWKRQLESGLGVLEACGRTSDTPKSNTSASMLQDEAGEVRSLHSSIYDPHAHPRCESCDRVVT